MSAKVFMLSAKFIGGKKKNKDNNNNKCGLKF